MQVTDVFSYEAACTTLQLAYEASKDGGEITIKEKIHDLSKKLLPINPATGLQYKSTSALSVKEFIDYIDKITAHWMEETNFQWEMDTSKMREHKNRKRNHMKGIE